MGDTSSGKSSVLSALSGIVFPSSDKLTTRCPTELILSHADKFSGSVYLQRYKGDKEGISHN
jgi:interferon-induced GTP-binding protein Mx1